MNENTVSVNRALDMGTNVRFGTGSCYIQGVGGRRIISVDKAGSFFYLLGSWIMAVHRPKL